MLNSSQEQQGDKLADRDKENRHIHSIYLDLQHPVLCRVVLYLLSIFAGSFLIDDDSMLMQNDANRDRGLYKVWFSTDSKNYWPVSYSFLWLESQLWKNRPAGFHFVSVVLHGICGILIWQILVRLKIPGAWLSAFLFIVHPVNVESVAWISQRKTQLSMLFFLISILSYLRFQKKTEWQFYALSLTSFLLAMLSKGSVVGTPLVILMCIWWLGGELKRYDVWRIVPFLFVALVMSAVEIFFMHFKANEGILLREADWIERIVAAGWVIWFYIQTTVFPVQLNFVYPMWDVDISNWISYLPGIVWIGLLLFCWRRRETYGRPVCLFFCYFTLLLGPVLGFVDTTFFEISLVADHYQYLAMVGLIALIVGVSKTFVQQMKPGCRSIVFLEVVVIILCLSVMSWNRCHAFQESRKLWFSSISGNLSCWHCHHQLALESQEKGMIQDSLNHYQKSIKIDPENARVRSNYGSALFAQHLYEEAEIQLKRAVEIAPSYSHAFFNLGSVLVSLSKYEEAEEAFRQAVLISPRFLKAYQNLGTLLIARGRYQEAISQYEKIGQIEPENVTAYRSLAHCYKELGEYDKSLEQLQKILKLDARNSEVCYAISELYREKGETALADEYFSRAIEIDPAYKMKRSIEQ